MPCLSIAGQHHEDCHHVKLVVKSHQVQALQSGQHFEPCTKDGHVSRDADRRVLILTVQESTGQDAQGSMLI